MQASIRRGGLRTLAWLLALPLLLPTLWLATFGISAGLVFAYWSGWVYLAAFVKTYNAQDPETR